jgi:hypothetical protein
MVSRSDTARAARHLRHDPPLVSRPWVFDDGARQRQLGSCLDCVRCDRSDLREDFASYKRKPEFTEATVPAGLRSDRARRLVEVHVLKRQLRHRADPLAIDVVLKAGRGHRGAASPSQGQAGRRGAFLRRGPSCAVGLGQRRRSKPGLELTLTVS